ncbi:MAG TPA: transcription-repair coupling factor [Chthonomonadaceae bacterium]|nr:transcription-repair coupling factor [Chthonomonadaceae bacterium]
MALTDLPRLADQLPGFEALIKGLGTKGAQGAVEIEGLAGPAKGFALARLFARLERPLLVITYQQEQAQRLWDDLIRFGVPAERVCVLPSSQSLFLEGDITDFRVIGERIGALSTLASGAPCLVIGTAEAVLQRTSPPGDLIPHSFTLEAERTLDLDTVVTRLAQMGYEPASTVTRPGEFSRRGGILDVFPSTADAPVRIELFGDEIESIRPFDVTTQRSAGRHALVEIAPAREIRLSPERIEPALAEIRAAFEARRAAFSKEGTREGREAIERLTDRIEKEVTQLEQAAYFDGLEQYFPYLVPEAVCALDYLPENGILILDEPNQVKDHWERITADIQSARERRWERGESLDVELNTCPYETLQAQSMERPTLILSLLGRAVEGVRIGQRLSVNSAPMESYRGRLSTLADEIGVWLANECRVLLVSDQPHRVREICAELNLPVKPREAHVENAPGLFVQEGRLRAGFKIADLRLYLITDAELFGSARPVVSRRRVAGGVAISSILDLRENDFVVHIHHGIGVYRGLVKRKVEDNLRDYLLIEYQGGDRLFVPADQIDRVQRYIGAEGASPQVNKIGGNEWQRTTRRVREQAREMAGELIALYAARQAAARDSFGPDTNWQVEMEEAFPYEETPDQLRAIIDVKADLERDKPMDRLICGDVGFGKTEVALRAAFKVVTAGKQVAVLCPTTVLAAQHLTTFSERLAAYPIKIELLSRFRSRQEQAQTVKGLKEGRVDIVIATHRLLSKDVEFKNLGLVIVDEEQRFGVAHKERLKQLRKTVDVLTLSATPIPRTLSMALSGLRDMSVIEDPPEGRAPVLTYVREYDDDLIRDAILRELERDGQVYFVHNKVESIYHVAQRLKRLIPELRIEVGHGQMSEDELERVMFDFYHHQYDVLVCTTIIENGLDIPNVNTIIVDNADHMGLSQLYQLRGRVGRSNRQAYAYLFYRRHKHLTEIAERRLAAIKEFSALGSGYKVAMRDLEIRGAGNLLGPEQHGAMVSVGFDLYCQLLAQAVQEIKGEEVTEDILPSVDLPITAHIPNDYIPGEAERIYFYKRMSGVRSLADIENLQAELEDRFGDPPRPVWDALAVLRLRLRCKEAGISSIKSERTNIAIRFAPYVRLTPDAIRLLTYAFKGHRFTADGVVVPLSGPKVMAQVEEMVSVLEKALSMGKNGKGARSGGNGDDRSSTALSRSLQPTGGKSA